ncbi:MAG: transporter substrate-binding domain-containing protein [Pseudomonadota bacterium]|nr:transporter substrate-binding domain-containing protein [Pseudomonadota bacterium]
MSAWEACVHCGSRVGVDAERCPSCGSPHHVPAPGGKRARPAPKAGGSRAVAVILSLSVMLALVGAGVATLLLVATSPSPPAPATASDATPVSAAAPPAGGGFAALRQRGSLRVAADPDAAPFLSRTADGGYQGFEYGVMNAIAAEAGVPLTVVPSTFAELPGRLLRGEADLAIGQLSPTGAWAGLGWSTSYLQYSLCLVVPKRSPVKSLPALHGKRIGMYDDPVTTQLVTATVGAAYERVVFDDFGYFEHLANGKLDAVVYDCPLARHELLVFGDRLRVADDTLNVATYNVAMADKDAALQADVNRVLRGLGDQGLLARQEAQWLGGEPPKRGYRTAAGRVVVVERGETLASIAARELQSAGRAPELHAMNRDVLGNDPDALYAGLRLRVGP